MLRQGLRCARRHRPWEGRFIPRLQGALTALDGVDNPNTKRQLHVLFSELPLDSVIFFSPKNEAFSSSYKASFYLHAQATLPKVPRVCWGQRGLRCSTQKVTASGLGSQACCRNWWDKAPEHKAHTSDGSTRADVLNWSKTSTKIWFPLGHSALKQLL